jgi:clan AA aspartic protease (TIGR02281 family)
MIHELLIKKRKIIVSATIEGISDSIDFNFILDTGATKTVIDEEVARKIGFELFRLQKGDRLMTAGGAVHSKILKLPKFSLFGKDMVNFEVNVIKFPLQITLLADGVLGMDFLLRFKNIKFNFDERTIET